MQKGEGAGVEQISMALKGRGEARRNSLANVHTSMSGAKFFLSGAGCLLRTAQSEYFLLITLATVVLKQHDNMGTGTERG